VGRDLSYVTQLMDGSPVLIHSGIEREPSRLITDAAQGPSSSSPPIVPSTNKDAKLYNKRQASDHIFLAIIPHELV
jgi:hypothetical protein